MAYTPNVPNSAVDASNAPTSPVVSQPSSVGFATSPITPADKINQVKTNTSSISQLKFPDENIKYYMSFETMDYTWGVGGNTGRFNQQISTNGSAIILPLPDSLRDHLSVDWTEANILREAFEVAAKVGAGAAALAFGGGKDLSTSLASASKWAAAAGIISGGLQAAGVALRVGGIAPNQFITILLNGPKYKQHDYQWTLAPKTPVEAENLRKIIEVFNNRMSPALASSGLYWKFPSIFKIQFVPNEKYLFKHKPAVLTNFAIDYSGGHVPSFLRADSQTENLNPPEAIQIHAQFLEIEYWKNGDFGEEGTATTTSNIQNEPQGEYYG